MALTFRTTPGGLHIRLGEQSPTTPYTITVIVTHQPPSTATTYTVTYRKK